MTFAIQLSASLFSNNLLLAAASTIFAYFLIRIFYNLFLSPLSAIPGPWYFAISDFWLTLHILRLRQCKAVQELFEIYGPVVRVGPNKVVFRDVSTMRNVYSVHKFDKSSFYKSLLTYVASIYYIHPKITGFLLSYSNDNDHAWVKSWIYAPFSCPIIFFMLRMTTLDHVHHSIRRKSYAPHYTHNNVSKFQAEMHEYAFELINVCISPCFLLVFDCISRLWKTFLEKLR